MIEIDTLAINKNIFNPDKDLMDEGIGIWDLTRSSVSFAYINLKIKAFYTLTDDAQMRPDVVCLQAYGNMINVGSLMKINGISNPFAIGTGTLFAIPDQERLSAAFPEETSPTTQILPLEKLKKERLLKLASPEKSLLKLRIQLKTQLIPLSLQTFFKKENPRSLKPPHLFLLGLTLVLLGLILMDYLFNSWLQNRQ
jgi:hypothetical protein